MFDWQTEQSKLGTLTLKLNGHYVYSKYDPIVDVQKFIDTNVDSKANGYILLGLGLGYHLECLLEYFGDKPIYILLIDDKEEEFFLSVGNKQLINNKNVTIVKEKNWGEIIDLVGLQFVIPFAMLNALDQNHPLRKLFETLKLNEMSSRNLGTYLESNLKNNLKLNDPDVQKFKNRYLNRVAFIVSAGPSIDELLSQIKKAKGKVFILCVGSALRIMLKNGIIPDAVIISDSKPQMTIQFEGLVYNGPLFYLATASKEVVNTYHGNKYILFQKGFAQAEKVAKERNVDVFEVGGSVATFAFSFLEFLGCSEIILCGQDFGFKGDKTHSEHTTSGVQVNQDYKYFQVEANSGEMINIFKSFNTYLKWFHKKVEKSNVKVYSTAWHGAKIDGVKYLSVTEFDEKITMLNEVEFNDL